MPTDTSEKGLETLIVESLVNEAGYVQGSNEDYSREHVIDLAKLRAFHSYTMKQAIQEGFILDVLAHYTPVESFYRLMKTVEHDPEFDTKKAKKKLRRYVESHDHAIRQKAEIMVDHFHEQVIARQLRVKADQAYQNAIKNSSKSATIPVSRNGCQTPSLV